MKMVKTMQYIGRWIGRVCLLVLLVFFLAQLWFFSCIVWWKYYSPTSTSFMRAEIARLAQNNPKRHLHYQWIAYQRIALDLKRAVVTSEDTKFVGHDGIDWEAIEKAYTHNRKLKEARDRALAKGYRPPQRPLRGGSTITQQVAKNLFLSGKRSYLRKIQEFIITYMLELIMSKQRILEIYLNIAEWGEGVFGVEAAARHYFGISAWQLNSIQAAQLAAMLPRPRYYDKHRDSPYLASRVAILLERIENAEVP